MQINMQDVDTLKAIVARLTKELGETFAANCACDLIADSLLAKVQQLESQNAALIEKTTADRALIMELRAQRDNSRKRPAK